MSYATHALAHRVHPDAVRIIALSATIALNASMMLVALRPLAADLMRPAPPRPNPTVTIYPDPVPPIAQPPQPQVQPLQHALPQISTPTVQPAVLEPSTFSTPAPPVIRVPVTRAAIPIQAAAPTHAAPMQANLAYLQAPAPTYPMQARRLHMQGTVVLRVLVDASGRPLDVVVERSSGYLLLDRSARTQVLKNWRFQPAHTGGHSVSAWARVPIHFNLQSL